MPRLNDFEEHDLLNRAFGRFNEIASALCDSYERLHDEVAALNVELAEKNQALSSSLAEQERTRKFLTHIMDNLTTGVVVLDPEGRIALANRAATRLLGQALDQVMGRDVLSVLDPASLAGDREPDTDQALEFVVSHGPDGRLLSLSLSAFSWPGRQGLGRIALFRDVTDETRIGAQRERTQVLSAMGEMAAEVAHQIRNPLGSLELFASILAREVSGDDNLETLVEHLRSGVKQVNHLITNYLSLSHPPRPEKSPLRLDRLIEEAVAAAAQAMNLAGIEARVRIGEEPVWVEADRDLLLQVFLNLILNAVEALSPGGRIEVDLRPGPREVEVLVRDTGPGIPREDLDRIFNPFFTTKEKKLGLGLAVSHQVVDAHRGLIQVKTRPGQGTTVSVTLPVLKKETQGQRNSGD